VLTYFSIAARITNPSTTLIRAIQLPLFGNLLKYDGKSASAKNGRASRKRRLSFRPAA